MNVDIVGEDQVTQNIIIRLLTDYRPDIFITGMLPARGSQIKSLAPKYNRLGLPIILLTDLDDEHCAPSLISKWLDNQPLSETMLFRVACDEAESWLMADREGFANWLSIDVGLIPLPKRISSRSTIEELHFRYKPSLFMMKELASQSKKQKLREELMPRPGAGKGPAYNVALKPFIKEVWNIENAAQNSDSLARAIRRVQNFNPVLP